MNIRNIPETIDAVAPVREVGRIWPTAPIGMLDTGNLGVTAGQGATFASALTRTLSQAGVSTATSLIPGTRDSNPSPGSGIAGTIGAPIQHSQTLNSFMENLIGALHRPSAPSDPGLAWGRAGDASRVAASSESRYPRQRLGADGTNVSRLELNLRALIRQLSALPTDASTSPTASLATDGAPSNDSTDAFTSLQTSYQSLLSSLGNTSDNASSLGNFLQALSHNLQDVPSSGSIVNIYA